MMVNKGKEFEGDFKASLESFELNDGLQRPLWVYRPSDFGGGQAQRFTNHSICDYIVYDKSNGYLYLLELKSTKSSSLSCPSFALIQEIKTLEDKINIEKDTNNKKEFKKHLKELIKKANSYNIKYHQIKSLLNCNNNTINNFNITSYFILNFRNNNCTYIITPYDLVQALKDNTKTSINQKDIINYNGKKINQYQIRKTSHFDYDLNNIFRKE